MKLISVRVLTNIVEKSVGMIGSEKPFPLFFTTRFGIHTFGMRFPIDVLILDPHFRIVKIAENVKPNRVLFWSPLFYNVVELPEGDINKHAIRTGQILTLTIV